MQQDMEHNAYNHHLDFNREQTVGIVAYLFFDVKQPSPSLFLSDPAAYTAQVQHAGMRAALAYLRYGGYPALYTLTCARASWGGADDTHVLLLSARFQASIFTLHHCRT